jgi:hypothetical protein
MVIDLQTDLRRKLAQFLCLAQNLKQAGRLQLADMLTWPGVLYRHCGCAGVAIQDASGFDADFEALLSSASLLAVRRFLATKIGRQLNTGQA